MSEALTNSRLKAFRACARLHHYRYEVCAHAVTTSGAARFGTLFHAGLEAWWLAYQLDVTDRFKTALGAMRSLGDDMDVDDYTIAVELMRGYHERWKDEPLITELAEHEFEMPLVNPATGRSSRTFVLKGKIDAKVTDQRDWRSYLVEHKTTTSDISDGAGYWQRLRMDGQITVYYGAFPEVAGCIYDVIRRPLLRRYRATPEESRTYTLGKRCKLCADAPISTCETCGGTGWKEQPRLHANQRAGDESPMDFQARVAEAIAKEPDSYYKRGTVVRLDNEMREHQLDIWHQANSMREMANEGLAPRNPDACIQYNRTCDYFDVCTGVASIDDPRLFQIQAQHPELAKETPNV